MRPIEEAFNIYCEQQDITDLSIKAGVRRVFYSGAYCMFMLYEQILKNEKTGVIIERLVEVDLKRFEKGD